MALVVAGALAAGACTGAGAPRATPSAAPPAPSSAAPSATPTTPTPTPTPTPTIGESEGMLAVLTYRGYAEYGGTAVRANWVGPFEKETGCRVVALDQVRTPAELAGRFPGKSYDVVSASPELAGRLIDEGRVRRINTSLIPEYADIPKRLRTLPAYTRQGNVYGVPFLWRADLLIRRAGVKAKNWRDLYESDEAAVENDPMGIALAALATGAKEPYRLTVDQLDEAVALLIERRERLYWSDRFEVIKGFATGELKVAQATPYELDLLRRGGHRVSAVTGVRTTGRADAWMISADAPHPGCAQRWLSWVATAEVQREAAAWNGLAPANPAACTGAAERVCDAYRLGDEDRLKKIVFAARPPAGCDEECTDYDEWQTRWSELID